MTSDSHDKGEDDGPLRNRDSPCDWDEWSGENSDGGNAKEADGEGNLKALENLGYLLPKVGTLDFLLRCSPSDIVGEHMGQDGDGNVDAKTTEKEEEEWNPDHVLEETPQEALVPESVLQQGIANIAKTWEDDSDREKDLETMHVEAVHFKGKAEHEVVEHREKEGGGETVVREHVGHHGDLVVNRGVRPEEDTKLLVDRANTPPSNEGVEDQLITTIRILLPSVKLIVAGQRDTFLESTFRVSCPSNDVAFELKTKGHVEIF